MKKVRVCSLFSGIGGFETGVFQALGKENVDVVFSSEIDDFASKSYEIIYGDRPKGDIREVHEKDVPDHDLLVAGFPCQAFSIAGHRLGFSDTRGTLFFEIARIAKEKQPRVMLLENVKGLLSHENGKTIETIIKVLSDLNYTVDFQILNSKQYGVPQNRERIFIVCVLNGKTEKWDLNRSQNSVKKVKKELINDENIHTFNFSFPVPVSTTTCINDVLEKEIPEKYYLNKEKTERLLKQLENKHENEENSFLIDDQGRLKKKLKPLTISPTLRREMHGNEPRVVEVEKTEMKMVGLLDMKGNESIRRVYDPKGISPTLTTMGGGHREPKILVGETKKTYRIRKLTPLECFRLQGFPDEYYQKLRESKISDTQLYKMSGNAVTTKVISAIVKEMIPYIKHQV